MHTTETPESNPLRTRADLQDALRSRVVPLERYVSPGGAWVRLGATGAHYADVWNAPLTFQREELHNVE
ncbi:MAG: hypothetical protein HC828_01690 [Blastochloris sp.]|nr:hypothetical protein [Blastochloris sp.]